MSTATPNATAGAGLVNYEEEQQTKHPRDTGMRAVYFLIYVPS